eukprot:9279132-Prorocentrum_lima.AAC.1
MQSTSRTTTKERPGQADQRSTTTHTTTATQQTTEEGGTGLQNTQGRENTGHKRPKTQPNTIWQP